MLQLNNLHCVNVSPKINLHEREYIKISDKIVVTNLAFSKKSI